MNKQEEKEKETYFIGYFLLDSGFKVKFRVSKTEDDECGEKFSALYYEGRVLWESGDRIFTGEDDCLCLLANRVAGYFITEE